MEHFMTFMLLVAVVGTAVSLPARINVGGIFESDDEELRLAFETAVALVNKDRVLLKNFTGPYRPVMAYHSKTLHAKDCFDANEKSCELLREGVVALFGPQASLPAQHVQSLCDDLEVPHMEMRWEGMLRRDQLSLNLHPHPSVLAGAFVRIVYLWHWEEFCVVYEDDEAMVRLKDFLEEGERQGWRVRLLRLTGGTQKAYRQTFWSISRLKRNDTEHRIVLDVPRSSLYNVLKAAQQVGMMTKHQKYLITSLDLHTIDLEDFQHSKTNITGLRLVQPESSDFQKLLGEMNVVLTSRGQPPLSTLKTESALAYDGVRLLAAGLEQMDTAKNVTYFPPIYCDDPGKGVDGTTLLNFMKNLKSLGLTGKISFDEEGFRSSFSLDIMYVTGNGMIKIGTIEDGTQINMSAYPEDSDFEYSGLENSHFKVTTALSKPYVMWRDSPDKKTGNERFEGYGVDLLDELSHKLRFTYEIHEVRDRSYGRYNATTKTWNGMIGEVISGQAHMAIADLTINTERLTAVDFTLPFMQTGISILFKKPTQKVTSLFSFLSPFSGEVWILVMAAVAFISVSYFLVGRLSPYEWSNPHPCRQNDQVEENVFSLLNSMWFAIGSLMQQGSDIAPTAMSTRAITSIWYFFCLIMISSYTANLAAFLTVENIVSPINNADELANQEKIKYGCLGSGSTRSFFQKSNKPTFEKMHRFMQKNAEDVYMKTNDEGIARVKDGDYAYLMEATSIEYNTERECNLTQIGHLLDSKGYGIAVHKDNQALRQWLSGGILKLQEEGKLHTFKERWWKQKKGGGICAEASKSSGSVNELGLGNVGGVFVVMLLGICLSAAVGVFEFVWFQRKIRRDSEMSLFKLLMREIKYAVTCGSSSKPAPKLKSKPVKEPSEATNYNSLH